MANKLYDESKIADIANAIRSQNGQTTDYTVAEMTPAIKALPRGGVQWRYI